MRLSPYENYVDTNVEWLERLPENWHVSRLDFKTWVRARLGWKGLKADEYVDDGYVFLSTPNIKGRLIDFENVNFINQHRYEESPEIKLKEGDVLLAKDGSTLGTVNIVRKLERAATVNSSIAVITPDDDVSGLFLYYLFQSSFMQHTIQRIKGGMGVPHLFQNDLRRFALPLPSRSEQRTIAAFLDRETARIDALIDRQEKLIALLEEKRQAVISQAVTKGLDPNAPMKDSGIEWLEEIPAHWEVKRLKYVVRARGGGTPSKSNDAYWDGDVPWVSPKDMKRWKLQGSADTITQQALDETNLALLNVGHVLVVVRGLILARAFPVALNETPVTINQDMKALKPTVHRADYLARWLKVAEPYLVANADESGHGTKALRWDVLGDLSVLLPPMQEQARISAWVDDFEFSSHQFARSIKKQIAVLSERRASLISAAVTGQIDVSAMEA